MRVVQPTRLVHILPHETCSSLTVEGIFFLWHFPRHSRMWDVRSLTGSEDWGKEHWKIQYFTFVPWLVKNLFCCVVWRQSNTKTEEASKDHFPKIHKLPDTERSHRFVKKWKCWYYETDSLNNLFSVHKCMAEAKTKCRLDPTPKDRKIKWVYGGKKKKITEGKTETQVKGSLRLGRNKSLVSNRRNSLKCWLK